MNTQICDAYSGVCPSSPAVVSETSTSTLPFTGSAFELTYGMLTGLIIIIIGAFLVYLTQPGRPWYYK